MPVISMFVRPRAKSGLASFCMRSGVMRDNALSAPQQRAVCMASSKETTPVTKILSMRVCLKRYDTISRRILRPVRLFFFCMPDAYLCALWIAPVCMKKPTETPKPDGDSTIAAYTGDTITENKNQMQAAENTCQLMMLMLILCPKVSKKHVSTKFSFCRIEY